MFAKLQPGTVSDSFAGLRSRGSAAMKTKNAHVACRPQALQAEKAPQVA